MKLRFFSPVFLLILASVLASMLGAETAAPKSGQSMDKMWGEAASQSDVELSERAALFRDGNYGMFIHWGLYSKLAGEWKGKTYYGISEWIMNPRVAGIPPEEYETTAKEFNPVDFDAKAIVQLAKDAGMKWIIITSKHHEGFAMFDSAHPFNIVDATPFGRDPMKELADACEEADLGFGFYYSHNRDWTSPGGNGGPKTNADGSEASFEQYFREKCFPQVKEICSNYGELDYIWFDTPGGHAEALCRRVGGLCARGAAQCDALQSGRSRVGRLYQQRRHAGATPQHGWTLGNLRYDQRFLVLCLV